MVYQALLFLQRVPWKLDPGAFGSLTTQDITLSGRLGAFAGIWKLLSIHKPLSISFIWNHKQKKQNKQTNKKQPKPNQQLNKQTKEQFHKAFLLSHSSRMQSVHHGGETFMAGAWGNRLCCICNQEAGDECLESVFFLLFMQFVTSGPWVVATLAYMHRYFPPRWF